MDTSDESQLRLREAKTEAWRSLVAFNRAMALETEGKELETGCLEAGIHAALSDPERGRYFLAEQAGQAVACLMLTKEWSDWRNGWYWWIQSVFVAPEARASGIFRRLYGHVIQLAREAGNVVGVRLYVDSENRAAQSVYEALGMSKSHYLMYELDLAGE